jgi:hypothetical protein
MHQTAKQAAALHAYAAKKRALFLSITFRYGEGRNKEAHKCCQQLSEAQQYTVFIELPFVWNAITLSRLTCPSSATFLFDLPCCCSPASRVGTPSSLLLHRCRHRCLLLCLWVAPACCLLLLLCLHPSPVRLLRGLHHMLLLRLHGGRRRDASACSCGRRCRRHLRVGVLLLHVALPLHGPGARAVGRCHHCAACGWL